MGNQKLGKQTFRPDTPPVILGYGSAAGKKECEGPLGGRFDHTCLDDRFGEKSWEKAESAMQELALDAALKRAGLDYWPMVDLTVYRSLDDFFARNPAPDLWLATTKAPRDYTQARFRDGCWLFFGKETAGLPLEFREKYRDRCLRIPMRADARSLNLSNSVAILAYEALKQQGFPGLTGEGEMVQTEDLTSSV